MARATADTTLGLAVCAAVLLLATGACAAPARLRLSRTQRTFAASVAPATGAAGVYGPALTLRPAVAELLHHSGVSVPEAPTTANLPLNGSVWPVGGFETPIYLGTPPQIQLVQIDTGSADLLVAQKGCAACPNPKYDPTRSSTSRLVMCNSTDFFCKGCAGPTHDLCFYNNTYETCDYSDPEASCSLLGTTFYDVASLGPGSSVAAKVGFGGIQQHQGAFDNEWTNMPGVMGMGYPALAGVWKDNTVFNSWVAAGDLDGVFGMCVVGDGGHMTLGGIDSQYYTGTLVYTPVVEKAWYVLHMSDLQVSGTSVGLPAAYYNKIGNSVKGTILDSGTNTFVIGQEAYERVQQHMVANCASEPLRGVCDVAPNATLFSGACYSMTAADIAAFPPVAVVLKGTTPLSVYGQQYLIAHPEKDGHYCMGIQSSGTGGFTILGNVFQSAFYVVFDQVNTRLGFAPVADCSA